MAELNPWRWLKAHWTLQQELQETREALRATKDGLIKAVTVEDALRQELLALRARPASARSIPPSLLPPYHRVEHFRWAVLTGYGFNAQAISVLASFPLTVKSLTSQEGGGLTFHDHVELNGIQHEAALHEFCHVLHERDWGLLGDSRNQQAIDEYLARYLQLEQETRPEYVEAAAYARIQLRGDGVGFPGILALGDWDHAFVSLASWCMGKYKIGSRALPEYMWPFFERFFNGDVLLTPYYEAWGVR